MPHTACLKLKAGEAKEIYLETVKKELDELLEHIELPEITLEDLDGKAHTLNDLTKDGPILTGLPRNRRGADRACSE